MTTHATRLSWLLAMGVGALVACRGERDALNIVDAGAAEGGARVRDALRDQSRLILERHCGRCHIREYPTAVPRALAVFDLREPEWSRRMSDAQLTSAVWRLGEPLPPDGVPNEVSDEERAQFKRFVEVEMAERAHLDGGKR